MFISTSETMKEIIEDLWDFIFIFLDLITKFYKIKLFSSNCEMKEINTESKLY